ncbi:MAG TPA: twin-arginine translocation signal domain-containing protein [Candidatus Aminicenantes bacterium]|nr:twin-arginine translocation signal domain-containing protein [Candidatus Aminicenantes bacterium]
MSPKPVTRRDFLKVAAAAPLAGAAVPAVRGLSPSTARAPAGDKVRVVLVRDPAPLGPGGAPPAEVVQRMLDDGVRALLGEQDVVKAWKSLIGPDDVVGIKTNSWRYIPTTAEVEQALKRRVMDAGVAEDRIGIDDQGVLRHPVFQKATALVNARPMRSHYWSGVGSLIKNYIMFAPRPSAWHGDACADLAKIWDLPAVKGKTRLNVLVMFTPLFHSVGPHNYAKEYTWDYKGLILSRDPVAADATGLRVIQAKRREHFGDDRPLPVAPHHIRLADTRHHLGTSDPARIELVKLGWAEGAMI